MGVALAEKPEVAEEKDERRERLLKLLTYEVVDGKPVYYRGYKDVLEGKKQPEEVMGSSTLQAFIVKRLLIFLVQALEGKGYEVLSHEVGLVGKGFVRALDIGIFRVDELEIKDEYANVPPVVAIEVDTKADLEGEGFMEYMKRKIDDLLGFGVKRVIWILTKGEVVVIAENPKRWEVLDWEDEVEVWEGVKVKLSELLKRP